MSGVAPELSQADRSRFGRYALWLAYASVAYNLFEATVAIWAGREAGSLALISFGGDSVVECLSAIVIVWQFRAPIPEERERKALKGIAIAFFALAAYVSIDAVRSLVTGADPDVSPAGMALAVASLILMPALAAAKRRVGHRLGSASVEADSLQTILCMYLSGVLLLGLLINATLGWGWADPVAALIIAAVAANEGREAWGGEVD